MVDRTMPHSYSQLLTHIIFSTKNRQPLIDLDLESRLFPYMGGILRQLRGTLIVANGVEDHVHLLVELPGSLSAAEAVGKIKANSTLWIHESFSERSEFWWQRGYAAFSVSHSNMQAVVAYIEGQKAHHRKASFKEEFVLLLRRHGISPDEKYLWT